MTRKRFSAFLLASALLLVFLTNVVFADGGKKKQTILTSGDYQYVLLEDGSAELLYCLSDDAEIVIPDTLDGHRVTSIDTISFSLSLTASHEGRGVMLDVVRETAKKVFVPLTVGGGIKTVDDIRDTLRAGADKVSVNSQAVQNPQLIKDGADIFGCQCICVGVDAKKVGDNKWTVYINGGRVDMRMDLIDWVKKCEQLGAGEICLNSIDTDGVRGGFDLPMLKAVCSAVKIPVIASGGAGKLSDFAEAFLETDCSAALAASLFHFKELTVGQVKDDCRSKGIIVR